MIGCPMTISSRTRIYRIALAVALAVLAAWIFLFASFLSGKIPNNNALPARIELIQKALGTGMGVALAVAVLCIMGFAYSKTVSHELFFFALWAFSCTFEAIRLAIFMGSNANVSIPLISIASRIVIISRYFGLFSLFTSTLYAAGFRNDRLNAVLAAITLLSIAIGTGLPLETASIAESFMFRPGFLSMLGFFEIAVALIALINLAYAFWLRGERSYGISSIGCACCLAGTMLLREMTGIPEMLAASCLLGSGVFLYMRPLHAYYLWQ